MKSVLGRRNRQAWNRRFRLEPLEARRLLYGDPLGGWSYLFDGSSDADAGGFTALDGTWSHANNSDDWDGTAPGEGIPGGVVSVTDADDTGFLRLQDTGDPSDYGFGDSNSQLFFGHNISAEGAADNLLDAGVTLTFRTRLATGEGLDDLHPKRIGATSPWPASGDGYKIHGSGQSNFVIHQAGGGTLGFALGLPSDGAVESPGLLMNSEFGDFGFLADTGRGGRHKQFDVADPTQWHEFWMTIEAGGVGTHQVTLYANGDLNPTVFDVTAANSDDFQGISYLAMGVSSDNDSGAFDVDFFGWKDGVHFPTPDTPVDPPVVVNDLNSALYFSADIGGTVTSTGGHKPSVTLYWGENDGGTDRATWDNAVDMGANDGSYSLPLTGLNPSTTYFFRSLATNVAGDVWTESASLTTLAVGPAMIVSTPAEQVTALVATVGATVQGTGGDDPDVTLYWGANDGGVLPSNWDHVVDFGTQTGDMSTDLVELSPETAYYYRTTANNQYGVVWTDATSFTTQTLKLPEVFVSPFSQISAYSAVVTGEVSDTGGDPPEVIIYWGDEDSGASADDWDHGMSLGVHASSYSSPLLRLESDTTYHVRALVKNAAGEQWSTSAQTFTTAPISPLRITEFSASNGSHLTTRVRPSGDVEFAGEPTTPDWLEIHNSSDMPIHLGGLSLTDARSELSKWTFPDDATISAGSYAVVFASGRSIHNAQLDEQGFLHTSFQLSGDGEYLALTSFSGDVISSYDNVPRQRVDISYGLGEDDTESFFESPTPGAPNMGGVLLVGDTEFRPDRGFYSEPFQVTITSETLGAEIYYTLDGSEPDPMTGQLYTGPVDVATTTTLRAAAFKDGYVPTNVDTHTYIFVDDVIQQGNSPVGYPGIWAEGTIGDYEMDPEITENPAYADRLDDALLSLPSVSVVTAIDNLFDPATGIYMNTEEHGSAWERAASVELIFPDGSNGFQEDAAMRIQGGASRLPWKSPKHAFRLNFKSEFGASKLKYDWFGGDAVTEFDTINLRAGFNHSWIHHNTFLGDNRGRAQYVRDQWAKDTQRAMGHAAAHNEYAHLYVNGMYWGIYNPTERPTASWAASYWGGEAEDYDVFNAGALLDGSTDAWREVSSIANNGLAGDAEYESFAEKLDIDGYIDYMLLNHYGGNGDWDDHNWYLAGSREEGGKFRFISWDAELIFIGKNDNNIGVSDAAPGRLLDDASDNDEFLIRFADRIQRHFFNGGVLTPDSVVDRWNARSDQISEALVAESARWGDYRRDINNQGTPLFLYEPDVHWAAERNRLLNDYFPDRTDIVVEQYRARGFFPSIDAPTFSQRGGNVSNLDEIALSATSGTVYYTTDGSDPRLKGGEINPAAMEYAGPVSLSADAIIRVRALSNEEWSALDEASFLVDVVPADMTNLRISEINYNPHAPTEEEKAALPDIDDSEFEFVEIYNAHPTDGISLEGMSIADGVSFSFPAVSLRPGEYAVVVENLDAFQLRYGSDTTVLGEWSGGLSNSGETIQLSDDSGATVFEVAYGDNDPWPVRADGAGATLELVDPANTPSSTTGKQYSWRGSTELGGSPGELGSEPAGVLISEVLSNTDLPLLDTIELYNPTTAAIAVGGWYLSDTSSNLLKYEIPSGAVIGAGEYLVFDESDFNPSPSEPAENHFALSGLGDDVWLVIPDGEGGVSKFVDDVHFGATVTDESLGRIPDVAGRLVPLGVNSLGCRNTHARVGPLVITELNYNPGEPTAEAIAVYVDLVEDDLEFVEIYNPASADVELTGWRLRGGADYDFDDGAIIGAGETILILSFEPNDPLNAERVQAVRAHYGIDDSASMVGGFAGQLSDSGEVVRLQRANEPLADDLGTIPRVIEDEVLYDDLSPWPTDADGTGNSLQRMAPVFYGSQATSWSAKGPTPGSVEFSGNVAGDMTGDGAIDAQDIDVLFDVINVGSGGAYHDLNSDGAVSPLDVEFLVQSLIGTQFGDATLDGYVDGSDFNRWNDAKFACSGRSWADGDFNGDSVVDGADYNLWNAAKFTGNGLDGVQRTARIPRAPAAAVLPMRVADDILERLDGGKRVNGGLNAKLVDRFLSENSLDGKEGSRSASRSRFGLQARRQSVPSHQNNDRSDPTSLDLAIASEVSWRDAFVRLIDFTSG